MEGCSPALAEAAVLVDLVAKLSSLPQAYGFASAACPLVHLLFRLGSCLAWDFGRFRNADKPARSVEVLRLLVQNR
jgi:hypothetical protein